MLFSQNTLPYPFPDPVYQHGLPMGTPLEVQSTSVNDMPKISAVCPASTSPPPPSSPLPSQAATFDPPKWYKIPQSLSPYGPKQWEFVQQEPILFHVGGFPGVSMGDALRREFTALQGRDNPVLRDVSAAITLRLQVRLSNQFYFRLAKS